MEKLIKSGNIYQISQETFSCPKLPVGIYNLKYTEKIGFYLEEREAGFRIPKKIYGDMSLLDRWKTAYHNSKKNLGILLSGYKGSGKTLMAEKFCLDIGLPVIMINSPFVGQELIEFLTSPVLGNVVVFIDEYEKLYKGEQEAEKTFLSLLDGPYNTHHVHILTVNNLNINENLISRPGRIRHHSNYAGLSMSIIEEVCKDLLEDKSRLEEVLEWFSYQSVVSFDVLISVIDELNWFKLPVNKTTIPMNILNDKLALKITEVFKNQCIVIRECYRVSADFLSLPDSILRFNRDEELPVSNPHYSEYESSTSICYNIEIARSELEQVSHGVYKCKKLVGVGLPTSIDKQGNYDCNKDELIESTFILEKVDPLRVHNLYYNPTNN